MISALQSVGYGIIGLAILIGIGLVILAQFSTTVASCPDKYTFNQNGSGYSFNVDKCCGNTNATCTGVNQTNPSVATQNVVTMAGYMGTSSGGLASWIPVIIVLTIGLLFLGAFISRKGRQS